MFLIIWRLSSLVHSVKLCFLLRMQTIYNYYVSVGEDNAKEKSAIDVGVLLKQVLSDDVYWEYELKKGYTNEYRRIGRK